MLQSAIKRYYVFFDETIQSSTFIVLMITFLIFAAGSITTNVHAESYKWNIQEIFTERNFSNTVIIEGVEYQLHFTRLSSK